MQMGMIGLGRMGGNMVRRLLQRGHECAVYDRDSGAVQALQSEGALGAASLSEFVAHLSSPRAIFIMVPAALVQTVLDELIPLLEAGDMVIDGGNSHYQDDIIRAGALAEKGIRYIDMGTSGGVWGLERGYCLMIGGEEDVVNRLDAIFAALNGEFKEDRDFGKKQGNKIPFFLIFIFIIIIIAFISRGGRGGKGGGGAELTDYGKALIVAFDDINKNCWEFLDKQLEKIENL